MINKYIKEIRKEVGGGGDILTEIHLDGGAVIYLAYGMIGVYTADQWAEFSEACETGETPNGPMWGNDNVRNLVDETCTIKRK